MRGGGAVPAAPTDLSVTRDESEVALSWAKPGDAGGTAITGYTVLRRTTTSSTVATSTLVSTATTDDETGLANGATYQFAVEAVNASGAGAATAWTSATPSAVSPPIRFGPKPRPPTRLRPSLWEHPGRLPG